MMKISKKVLLILIACFFGATSLQAVASKIGCVHENQIRDETENEKLDFVVEKAKLEIQGVFRSKLDLRIDFMQRFLDLDAKDLKMVKVFAKGFAKKWVAGIEEDFAANLKGLIEEIDGTTFTINGTPYTFDGEEYEETPFMEIKIKVYSNGGWLSLMVQHLNRGNGGGVSASADEQDFETSESFRKSLKSVQEDELLRAKKAIDEQKRQRLVNAFVVLLDAKLQLSPDQMPSMKDWVNKKLEGFPLTDDAARSLESKFSADTFRSETPEFLNDLQKESWSLLQHNKYPLGW